MASDPASGTTGRASTRRTVLVAGAANIVVASAKLAAGTPR
jgi:hypothetical protein